MDYLDTTIKISDYHKTFRILYNYYFFKFRKKYLKLIDKNFYNRVNLDLISSTVLEKNITSSFVYHNLCLFFTIKKISSKKFFKTIIVNNKFLKKELDKILKKKTKVILKERKNLFFFRFKIIIKQFLIFLITKFFVSKKKFLKPITIVDKFVTDKNPNKDRYFNNYFQNQKLTCNVPTFVNLNLLNIIKYLINVKKESVLIKSKYLTLKDFIYSINFHRRIKNIKIQNIFFYELNIKELIKNELNLSSNYNASIISIQNYLFAKNLKKLNIKIDKIINWNENSIVDKGWNYGFRTFFSNKKTYGYQGYFVEKKLSSLDLTKYEILAKTCPEYIMILGPGLKKARCEFSNNLNFIFSKSLRFEYLHKKKFYKYKSKSNIIVLLNIDQDENMEILDKILNTKFAKNGNKIYIKEHPLLKLNNSYKKNLPNNFKIINGKFDKIAEKFKVVIASGSSSSVFESLLLGCKILFPINNYYDVYNLKLLKVPKSLYKVCESSKKLDYYINNFLNQKIGNFKYYRDKKKLRNFVNLKKKIF